MAETPAQTRIRLKAKAARLRAEKEKQVSAQAELMTMPDEFTGEATPEAKVFIPGMMRELSEGATLGGSGEIKGGIAGLQAMLRGESFVPAAQKEMAAYEARRKEFQQQYPKSAFAGEIVGSLPGGIAAGTRLAGAKLMPRLLAPTAAGATYGFLGTDGGVGERTKGAGIGAGIAGTLATGGAAFPAVLGAVKKPVEGLLARKVPLTPGQALGRATGYMEGLLGRTTIGELAGIPQAQRRAFEQFNIEAVEGVMKPLGYKIDPDQPLTEAVNQAKIFADKQFKKAIEKSSLPVTGTIIREVKSLGTEGNKKRFMEKYSLRDKEFDKFKKEIDSSVLSRIKDGSMTGEMMQDVISDLGARATKLSTSKKAGNRKLGRALGRVREEILDTIQEKGVNAEQFKRVRDVNRDIRALQKSATGADIFSPEQYRRQLEKQFGPAYMQRPQAQLAKEYIDVLGTGRAPVEGKVQDMSGFFRKMVGLAPAAAAVSLAPLPTSIAATVLPSIYRTGRTGTEAARMMLQAPGAALQRAAAMPSISGIPSGLLAGEQE